MPTTNTHDLIHQTCILVSCHRILIRIYVDVRIKNEAHWIYIHVMSPNEEKKGDNQSQHDLYHLAYFI